MAFAASATKRSMPPVAALLFTTLPWAGLRNGEASALTRAQLYFHGRDTPRKTLEIMRIRSKTHTDGNNLKPVIISHSTVGRNCPGELQPLEARPLCDQGTCVVCAVKEVLLHIALVEPIMRDLSPMPDGVDPDERTVFSFFRSTGNGMQFDVNKPLGLAAQRNLYLNAIRMAYPTGVRDGTPIVDIPFSKHSGYQGFIKNTMALLLAGLISTDTPL
mmetsp:Transcript_15623/g.36208  ORF Transcript_15623/g.36208 Transcript_15623/m.36208 type:complete len:217 (+) Transcript_15623:437-1087(+)